MPTILLTVLVVLVVLLLFLAALLIFRTLMYGRVPEAVEPPDGETIAAVEGPVLAEHLAAVLRLQTVSQNDPGQVDLKTFERLHQMLERMYPRAHATLRRERINHSLLYTWQGRAPELEPVALLAHLDVVPADAQEWSHPPFEGVVVEGWIWGRGALDLKSTLVAMLEAVEGLIKAGYQPERTLYLAFGHDEERGGLEGAHEIVAELQRREIRLAGVLDEGGLVADGLVPGLSLPAALVGIAEKGYATIEMKVEAQPGHSSMPPRHTAVGVLARAVARVENNLMPIRMSMARLMFADLGAFMPFSMRLGLANEWLFGRALRKRLTADRASDALVRSSLAVTRINGGSMPNVLPAQAEALVTCRLMPGDSSAAALEHIRRAASDDAVQVNLVQAYTWEASPVSPVDSPAYQALARAIRQVFPEAVVSPYLVLGATDSRHYAPLCANIYRFSPYVIDAALLKTFHGVDERIQVEALERMVTFYHQLIRAWTE